MRLSGSGRFSFLISCFNSLSCRGGCGNALCFFLGGIGCSLLGGLRVCSFFLQSLFSSQLCGFLGSSPLFGSGSLFLRLCGSFAISSGLFLLGLFFSFLPGLLLTCFSNYA